MAVPKSVRLSEIWRRLAAAPAAQTAEEARIQLASIINAVEDDLTAIPFDLQSWETDGRIYPPQDDSRRRVPGHPSVSRFRSRKHNTYIGANGSISIARLDGTVEVEKRGADGRGIWELNDS
jgi:GT2 family glycosyltransferase